MSIMKFIRLTLPVLAAVLVSGCADCRTVEVRQPATPSNPAGELVVRELPPKPSRETFDSAPNEAHEWVGGSWTRANGQWVWLPPHWE